MRKISNLLANHGVSLSEFKTLSSVTSDIQSQLLSKLPKPNSVFTVGSSNCDFSSLATALDSAATGDTIIIFGDDSVHLGPFNLKENQRIVSFGRTTLKADSSGLLFNCYGNDSSEFNVYFSGDFFYQVKNSASPIIKVFSDGLDVPLNAFVYLHGVYFCCRFQWLQSGTNNPNLQTYERNWLTFGSSLNPSAIRDNIGQYIFNNFLPPSFNFSQSYFDISLLSTNPARILFFDINAGDPNVLFFSNIDFAGAFGDNCNGICSIKAPLFFESA